MLHDDVDLFHRSFLRVIYVMVHDCRSVGHLHCGVSCCSAVMQAALQCRRPSRHTMLQLYLCCCLVESLRCKDMQGSFLKGIFCPTVQWLFASALAEKCC